MKHTSICLTAFALTFATIANAQDTKKTKSVELSGGLTLTVPATWSEQKSSSNMRLATFQAGPADGDKDPAELTVFRFSAQSVKANVNRWEDQFVSTGRTSKVTKGNRGNEDYFFVDISGTFKKNASPPGTPPFLQKKSNVPGYRMLGAIIPAKDSASGQEVMYFLKMTGPTKTVTAEVEHFRSAFGGNKQSEKEYSE